MNPRSDESERLVQVAILASLVGDDPAVIREFLADFRASSARLGKEVQEALWSGDHRRVGELAHRLKSSARAVGALALGDACAELEAAGRKGQAALVAERCAAFELMRTRVDAEIASHLSQD